MNKMQIGLITLGILIVLLVASNSWYFVRINDLQIQVGTLQKDKSDLQVQNSSLENQVDLLQDQITNFTLTLSKLTEIPLLQYKSLDLGVFAIDSGLAHNFNFPDWNSPVFTGGYGTISIYYVVEDVTPGNFTVTITLSAVDWFNGMPGQQGGFGGPVAYDIVNALNRTVVRTSEGFSMSYLRPILIQTKAPYFTLAFSTNTDSPNWQSIGVVIRVFVYFGN